MKIENAHQIVIFSFFFALIGIGIIPHLNIQYTPSGNSRFLRISYSGYGLSAEQLEREVCVPLESSIAMIRGIKRIRSETFDGSGSVDIEVNRFIDLDFLRFDLSSRIRALYAQFPDGLDYPIIEEIHNEDRDPFEEPILVYSMSAPRSVSFLARYATEIISPQVGRIEGVSQIRINGDRGNRIQIDLDPVTMKYYALQKEDVFQRVNDAYVNEAIGIWNEPDHTTMTVRLQGNYKADSAGVLSYLRGLQIPVGPQMQLSLQEVSNIYWKEEEVSSYYRINGQNALRLLVFPAPRTNHIKLAGAVKEEIGRIQSSLQKEIDFTLESDHTAFLKEELQKIYHRSALSLLILLIFVVFFYSSWKPLLIIFSGILVNLGVAFIFYYFLQIELNLYALAGITVTFGIVIDNSIVMIQHIRTQQNRRVFMALLTATLTTISALTIIFFLPEYLRTQLRYFTWIVVINLSVSLFVSLFFVPALMHLLDYDRKQLIRYSAFYWWDRFYTRYLLFSQRYRGGLIVSMIFLFGLPVFYLPTYWAGQEWYNKTIGSDGYRDYGRPLVNRIFGGTLRLFVYHAYEHGGFRNQEETKLLIQCRTEEGTNLEQTNALITYFENYLSEYRGPVKSYTTSIYNGGNALITVFFDAKVDAWFPFVLKDKMIRLSNQFDGAQWNIVGVGRGYSNIAGGAPPSFNLEFSGYDQEKIRTYSEMLKSKLEQHQRVRNVQINTSLDWFGQMKNVHSIDLDLHQVQQSGLGLADFRRIMNYYNLRDEVLLNSPALPQIDYSMRFPHADRWQLEHEPIWYEGRAYDLGEMISYSEEKTAESIVKVNQEYVQGIQFEYTGSYSYGEEYLDEVIEEIRLSLPLGFKLEKKELPSLMSVGNTKNYSWLLLIIGWIWIISAVHFESFRWPFVIISIIPLSFIGIFGIFYFAGTSFDQGGYTSFILVTGLSVNGLVYLLSDYKQLLSRGIPRFAAYKQAFEQKILPIFLTLLSTTAGLVPFVLIGKEDAFWGSLAVGSIGGILFSFIVIVFFTPAFLYLDKKV